MGLMRTDMRQGKTDLGDSRRRVMIAFSGCTKPDRTARQAAGPAAPHSDSQTVAGGGIPRVGGGVARRGTGLPRFLMGGPVGGGLQPHPPRGPAYEQSLFLKCPPVIGINFKPAEGGLGVSC